MDNPFSLIAKRKSLAVAFNSTRNQIEKGIAKKTASTGTPISSLKGGAKITAMLSNIGGGSKATGGSGMKGGMEKIIRATRCKEALNAFDIKYGTGPRHRGKIKL